MSSGAGVVLGGIDGGEVPLSRDAFRASPAEALLPAERSLCDALSPGSARLAGAGPEVQAAAAALRPFLVEAISYLRAFADRFVLEGAKNERAPVDFHSHFRRYAFTLALVRALAARVAAEGGRPARVLDVGGPGIVTGALRADENAEVFSTAGDLRRRFVTGPHREYDVVLCSEVIEHVTDPEVGRQGDSRLDYNAEVASIGARHMLARLAEAMGESGDLLLTTPNALSLYALRELGQRRPAMIFRPHYHEYTPWEILDLLREAGLDAALTTCEVYAFYDLSAEMEYLQRVAAVDARRFWGDTTIAYAWRSGRAGGGASLAAELEAIARAFARDEILAVVGLEALAAERLP